MRCAGCARPVVDPAKVRFLDVPSGTRLPICASCRDGAVSRAEKEVERHRMHREFHPDCQVCRSNHRVRA